MATIRHRTSGIKFHIRGGSGYRSKVEVRVGHSCSTILDAAEDLGADLIIIALHRPGL